MDQERFDIDFVGSRVLSNTRVDGSVQAAKEGVCLDGWIQGNVRVERCLIVNKSGVIDGDVECGELYINGTITGNVCVARNTVMGASAVIQGRLVTGSLEITRGAVIKKGLKLKKA